MRHFSTELYENRLSSFSVILLTEKQTNKPRENLSSLDQVMDDGGLW